ncbi:MAG: hypothetical protein AAF570_14305 [Bacteroidota bacterium]
MIKTLILAAGLAASPAAFAIANTDSHAPVFSYELSISEELEFEIIGLAADQLSIPFGVLWDEYKVGEVTITDEGDGWWEVESTLLGGVNVFLEDSV